MDSERVERMKLLVPRDSDPFPLIGEKLRKAVEELTDLARELEEIKSRHV
jgi:hypothetical protein